MKAIIQSRYGSADVMEVSEVEKPTAEGDRVLIRVRASSVNPLEWHRMTGTPYLVRVMGGGLLKPKDSKTGNDVAGSVETVGPEVTGFEPGDEVFGMIRGAYAEYGSGAQSALALKPVNLTFEQAAAVPVAGLTALQGLRDHGRVNPGMKVLINGASGGVGTFAVQIAKALGADVTAVCSTRNVEMVRSIGADRVIDYTKEDFIESDRRYDLLLDNAGNRSLLDCKRILSPEGAYVMVGGPKGRFLGPVKRLIAGLVVFGFGGRRMKFFVARSSKADLETLRELIEAGRVTPVIDRGYRLEEIREALRYQGEGHARGKTVITV